MFWTDRTKTRKSLAALAAAIMIAAGVLTFLFVTFYPDGTMVLTEDLILGMYPI